jgi:hypothetical protein
MFAAAVHSLNGIIKDSSSGKVVGCHAVLSQDVLPKGECEQCLNLYVCLLLLCIL